jgi:hypothetical protein
MSVGVPGQALLMYLPPPLVHEEVEMQTPGAPPEPVQGPSTLERGSRASIGLARAVEKVVERTKRMTRKVPYMLTECVIDDVWE